MASNDNAKWWQESARLRDKNKRRSARRKANSGIDNPKSKKKEKE